MSPHIKLHWMGIRKDSGKGSVWGYFTQTGKSERVIIRYSWNKLEEEPDPICYEFWGSIGKKMHIRERFLTPEFLTEAASKKKNFKEADAEKIMARWGKTFDEELSMHIMMMVMRG